MHDLAIDPAKVRKLSLAARVRLRWRLKARGNQLTPARHVLCRNDQAVCEELEREAWALYPQRNRKQSKRRDAWLRKRGHVVWTIWLILAGRGWGKTRTGAEATLKYMLEHPRCRVALVAATFGDGRDTMVEGESGILALIPRKLLLHWNRSLGELELINGSKAKIFASTNPERLRGPQHHWAWCDELAAWEYLRKTWDQLMFGLRLGMHPQVIITTTPRPLKFLRRLKARSLEWGEGVIITVGRTEENAENLAAPAVEALHETYGHSRLGRQELYGEILDDQLGTVIKQADIDAYRVEVVDFEGAEPLDFMGRVVVAVDPAVTAKKTSDETGIVVAGRSDGSCPICTRAANPKGRPHYFVLKDATPGIVTDSEWAAVAAREYRGHHADRVVAETNNGGDLVETVLQAAQSNLPVKQVKASRGKVVRAEPVGAMFERGMIHVVGHWPKMEDQLCSYGAPDEEDDEGTVAEDEESSSPDRADACVWAITELAGLGEQITRRVGTLTDVRGRGDR